MGRLTCVTSELICPPLKKIFASCQLKTFTLFLLKTVFRTSESLISSLRKSMMMKKLSPLKDLMFKQDINGPPYFWLHWKKTNNPNPQSMKILHPK